MANKEKKEKGLLTVEAILVLPIFIGVILLFLSLVNIASLQARMQIALNTSARQLSEYSYFYSLVGGNKYTTMVKEKGADVEDFNDTLASSFNAIAKIDNKSFDLSTAYSSITDIKDAAEKVIDNPTSLIYYFGNIGLNKIKSEVCEVATKALMKGNLKHNSNENTEEYLKRSGVLPGSSGKYMDGLDFEGSIFSEDGDYMIKCVVSYDVKIFPYLPVNVSYHFKQCSITRGWGATPLELKTYESKEDKTVEFIEKNDFWNLMPNSERNSFIRKQGMTAYANEGYENIKGVSGITLSQMYSTENNEVLAISSYDPLSYHEHDGSKINEITNEEIVARLNRLCELVSNDASLAQGGVMKKTTDSKGNTIKETVYFKEEVVGHLVLIVPEDEGIKEKVIDALASSDFNSRGVKVEIDSGYGNSAYKKTVIEVDENSLAEGDNQE